MVEKVSVLAATAQKLRDLGFPILQSRFPDRVCSVYYSADTRGVVLSDPGNILHIIITEQQVSCFQFTHSSDSHERHQRHFYHGHGRYSPHGQIVDLRIGIADYTPHDSRPKQ